MPCIVNQSHPTSMGQNSMWQSYCGRTVYFCDKPFSSPKDAIESGKPICKACRKAAGLPAKNTTTKKPFEPYTLYRAFGGELTTLQVVGETSSNYRLKSGELCPKAASLRDVYWRRAGGDAHNAYFTKDKSEAIAKAKNQLQRRKNYLQSLIEEADNLRQKLES